jgi:acetyl-CoA carboxylase carboxyl transferase subunit alpha
LIDGIIQEPLGGAHTNPEESYANVKKEVVKYITELEKLTPKERVKQRIDKFCAMGQVNENV